MAFENATIAPFIGGKGYCRHTGSVVLYIPTGMELEERVEKFLNRNKGNVALAKRLYKSIDHVRHGDVIQLEDGTFNVKSSTGAGYWHVDEAGHCECPDYQKGYAAYIAMLKANNQLPPPPID